MVSERKLSDDLKRIIQACPGAYLVLSPLLTIAEVSDEYLAATKTARGDIVGKKLFDVFPDNPEDPSASGVEDLGNSLAQVIEHKVPHMMGIQKYDIPRPASEGGGFEERYWSPKNTPVLDDEGTILYIIHSVEDVTEHASLRKLAQSKVPPQQRAVRGDLAAVIVDEMYQFVALLDKDGRLLEVNRPALEGTGLRMSDVRGEYMWEVPVWNVTPENFIRVKEASLRGCRGEFVREELQLYAAAAGKEAVTIDFSIKPIRDVQGNILFVLAEGRNITERKIAEAEIEHKGKELATLNERLRKLDRQKTEFFANVSHELRTPLSLIIGPIQKLLSQQDVAEKHKQDLTLVERNARFLLKHVNDLLDISKLEADGMVAHYSETDLASLGRYVASFFENLATERAMQFSVLMPPRLSGEIDREKIERVLLNLLSNAFKFTPDTGSIQFSLVVKDGEAEFVVSDSGPGIPEQLIPVVFERFRQVEGGTSRRHGGTGLGLSIVREFVALHKGSVEIANRERGGLMVKVRIPTQAPDGADILPLITDLSEQQGGAFAEELGYRNEKGDVVGDDDEGFDLPTILIVEDNDDVREFLKEILSIHYRTICARNGEEGLLKAFKSSPSLIIADVMMPQMSGEEMVRELKLHAGVSDIPILMLTARMEEDLRIRLLQQGVHDFLTKPFVPKELLARVERLIVERRKAEATLRMSEERYRSLVEATTSVVWTTNAEGLIDTVQQSWQRFTGQTPAESSGLGWMNAFHPDDRKQVEAAWREAVDSTHLFKAEGRIWNIQHAMYRFFVAHGISLKNPDGMVREWVVTIYDMHERATMEQRLRLSVREKETLLKEMHHRVKNNMQVISSLLRLQAKGVEEQRLRSILEESQNRIRAMALVHEKLYQSHTLSKINFGEYLTLLVRELFASSSLAGRAQVHLKLEIDPVELDVSKAIPCGLLINELISNSLKHAFPDGREGTVSVSLKRLPMSRVALSLSDDGIGLPQHTNIAHVSSLGLQIVKTLAGQMGGDLHCENGSGVRWAVEFDSSCTEDERLIGVFDAIPPDEIIV